jgi:hypothetical protein
MILATFNLLRLSIRETTGTWGTILNRSRVWIVLTVAMIGFCQTKFFWWARHWCIAWGRLRPNRFTVPASMHGFGSLRPSLLWLLGLAI